MNTKRFNAAGQGGPREERPADTNSHELSPIGIAQKETKREATEPFKDRIMGSEEARERFEIWS